MKYNLFKALIFDFLWRTRNPHADIEIDGWVRATMRYCFPDWVEWTTEVTMKDVDSQVEELKKEWAKDDPKPEIIEHPSDGSEAQELLGGALEIKSPWSRDGDQG